MPAVTIPELLEEARAHIVGDDPHAAFDSLAEAVQRTYEIAQAAAVRAGVPQEVQVQ